MLSIDRTQMMLLLDERFALFQEGKGGTKNPVDASQELATLVLARLARGDLPMKHLVAETDLPFVTDSGRLVASRGYDLETQVYLHLPRDYQCKVPAAPTAAEVRAALFTMMMPFRAYKWLGPNDPAAVLSAVMTAVLRPTMRKAAAYMFGAFVQGSGKTYAAQAAVAISTGGEAMPSIPPRDEDEWDKQVVTWVNERRRGVVVDNALGHLRSAALAGVLTGGGASGRELAKSRDISGSLRALITLTANRPSMDMDLLRRIVQINIDPGENPAENRHVFHPVHEALRLRMEIAEAVCTLLVAYFRAGAPRMTEDDCGGFTEWSRLCRWPLMWAAQQGYADELGFVVGDPAASLLANHAARDPRQQEKDELFRALYAKSEGQLFTSAEAYVWFCHGEGSFDDVAGDLREVLVEINRAKGRKAVDITSSTIGKDLSHRANEYVNGLCLRKFGGVTAKRTTWQVVKAENDPGTRG